MLSSARGRRRHPQYWTSPHINPGISRARSAHANVSEAARSSERQFAKRAIH